MTISRRLLAACASSLAAVGCSPLALFDTFAPRDGGTIKAGRALRYGDHPRQTLDIHVPETASASRPAPVIVFFYGGSWSSGSREEYDFVGAALAARGFVTVIPDYRLYPEVRFPDFLYDSALAVRFAEQNVAKFGGNGRRIILAGHSAGAYNAAMLALDGRYLQQAGVQRSSIRGFAGLSGPYDFLPLDVKVTQEVFGQAPNQPATQPISFAKPGSPPAFLATGDRDTLVYPKNTINLSAKLRASGVPVIERVYPGLDHKDTLLALSVPFRSGTPVLNELASFAASRVG